MRLGIDASNLRAGGGVTHLVELLRAAEPLAHGFSQVVVWGGLTTLKMIEDRSWLQKSHQAILDKSLVHRTFWQRFKLAGLARSVGCDVLLVPGGSYEGNFFPVVTMCRNMLPFEWQELQRYGWSLIAFRLLLLRFTQSRTFRHANGLIFLTKYAHDTVMRVLKTGIGLTTIIPHGVDARFSNLPREQLPISSYSNVRPFRVLYVSIIDVYKHQWHVAEAVAQLSKSGFPVVLDLVGPAYPPALQRLRFTLEGLHLIEGIVRYSGPVPHGELNDRYSKADLCVFASSCENMPNILLEGMASGVPIACSDRGPMPEVLKDGGVYFDPEDTKSIVAALNTLIQSPSKRFELANKAYTYAKNYTWGKCSRETFSFI